MSVETSRAGTFKGMGLVALSVVFVVAVSVLQEMFLRPVEMDPYLKGVLMLISGGLATAGFLWGYLKMSVGLGTEPMKFGCGCSFLYGAVAALAVSGLSGLLYSVFAGTGADWTAASHLLGARLLGNTSPALVEEVGFRGGVVHLLAQYFGNWAGLFGGSVPFGVLHLVGRLFGHPIDLAHVIGVSLGGLLLAVLYLRFGLWAAVSCHWLWNTLCSTWVDVLSLPKKGGVQLFEGAWTTSAVLAATSALLVWDLYRRGRPELAEDPASLI